MLFMFGQDSILPVYIIIYKYQEIWPHVTWNGTQCTQACLNASGTQKTQLVIREKAEKRDHLPYLVSHWEQSELGRSCLCGRRVINMTKWRSAVFQSRRCLIDSRSLTSTDIYVKHKNRNRRLHRQSTCKWGSHDGYYSRRERAEREVQMYRSSASPPQFVSMNSHVFTASVDIYWLKHYTAHIQRDLFFVQLTGTFSELFMLVCAGIILILFISIVPPCHGFTVVWSIVAVLYCEWVETHVCL